jgi:gamma-glutamyltranspeptidase/glutathione hydrolase
MDPHRAQYAARMLTAVLLGVASLAQFDPPPMPPHRTADTPFTTRSEVIATQGMAATSHPLATQIALDVLKAGGSAVDAAIAANAALGLMEPTGCGIGGDLFALVWDPKDNKLHGYNGSGRAGAAATPQRVRDAVRQHARHQRYHLSGLAPERRAEQIPAFGPLPVTVPGCVDGWFALHGRFGKLPMRDVLAPVIRYAREGHPVAPIIASAWGITARRFAGGPSDRPQTDALFPGFAEQFMIHPGGTDRIAPAAGEMWRNAQLASTLEHIAARGRDAFYSGVMPAVIEKYLSHLGGMLTAADFAAHGGEWVEPVSTGYRGFDVWQIPPNGQGIAGLQILNILERHDVRAMGWGSPDFVHLFVEAKKLAFEDRARYYADRSMVRVPVRTLISKEYAARRAALIDMSRAAHAPEPGEIPSGADTVYLTVADKSGMMVSLIQSNYRGMGSGMVPCDLNQAGLALPGTTLGFMLQNRGEQFALADGHPNLVAPGKRPFHTIIPSFITRDGAPWVSFGVMGGAMQPQGHAQIVINLIDFDMTLQQAGDAPRIHHDGSTEPQGPVRPMTDGGVLNLEPGFPQATVEELARRGHTLKKADTAVFGGYQAILFDATTGTYRGASESRKDGHAAGF